MGLKSITDNESNKKISENGIAQGKVYSILDVKEIEGYKLVKL